MEETPLRCAWTCRRKKWLLCACGLVVAGIVIILLLLSSKPQAQEADVREHLTSAVDDFTRLRFAPISTTRKQEILKSLADEVIPLDVIAVVSSTEARLSDGRALRLAYLSEAPSSAERTRARALLKKLLMDSNYVAFTIRRQPDSAGPRAVIENTPERMTALVAIHTGKMIISDVGMLLLENKLATVDLHSTYAENSLYKMEEEYLRTGKPPLSK